MSDPAAAGDAEPPPVLFLDLLLEKDEDFDAEENDGVEGRRKRRRKKRRD